MKNDVFDAVIEIPLGSKNKYELDKSTGRIHLDRVLYSAMNYPTEYGIIDETLAPDGDALDILVVSTEATYPGTIVPARVLGYLSMIDCGMEDYKLISVVDCDPRYDEVTSLDHLPSFLLKEIKNFFENYKSLQGIEVKVGDYFGKEDALHVIADCRERYRASKEMISGL